MKRIIVCIIFRLILLSACNSSKKEQILEGYSNCEEYYSDGFQDYTDYCKYFYSKDYDIKFEKSSYYSIVTKENLSMIKTYFENFPYENMNDKDKYDFEIKNINEGDYYCLKDDVDNAYSLFFYDKDNHTLYYIHNNI